MTAIPLVDLRLQGDELEEATAAIRAVLERGWFILGPEVEAFETELAAATGVRHAAGVGSGTDALILTLRALGVGHGDEVIVPAFTAFPTAAAVLEVGAKPVLVDVGEDTPLIDAASIDAAITGRTRAVIAVHLYGCVADVEAIRAAVPGHIALIEDCAQAQGALLPSGAAVGTAGDAATFSFYPTKNLGALGDGGAVVSDDDELIAEVRAWRSHGERQQRYRHELPARNSRLDDLQAAVLRLRLASLPRRVERRREISGRYAASLPAELAYVGHGEGGAPHLAVIALEGRDALAASLAEAGVGTGVHYPLSLDQQPALAEIVRGQRMPQARRWARWVLSLPLHDHLTDDEVARVIESVELAWRTAA